MSFTYKAFPDLRLKHGTEKQINDPVVITSNGNREIRRKINKLERYSWTVPSRNLYQSDANAIVQFFNTVHSSMDSFLYRCPMVPELIGVQMVPVNTGTEIVFCLYHTGMHPVMNLGDLGHFPQWDFTTSPITIKRNGTTLTRTTNFTVHMNYDPSALGGAYANYGRTLMIKAVGATWSGGDVVTFSGPIWHTARFDAMLSYKITAMQKSTLSTSISDTEVIPTVSALSDVKLVEVFEYLDVT